MRVARTFTVIRERNGVKVRGSLIEVTSGVVLLWRLYTDANEARRERVEAISLKIVGVLFVALAVSVAHELVMSLFRHEAPDKKSAGHRPGSAVAIVMPLVRAKRKVARGIQ